jgi:hypothetical protein
VIEENWDTMNKSKDNQNIKFISEILQNDIPKLTIFTDGHFDAIAGSL